MPSTFRVVCLVALLCAEVAFADEAAQQGPIASGPSAPLVLPGTQKKETHSMSPWQTPRQDGHGLNHPIIQAKCGDSLFFFWNAEKHGLFLIPTAECPELFIDASAAGIMELMPVTTEGNVTIELDEPGHFWFADPLYCRSHNMSVQVDVQCKNELPRFSDYELRSWSEYGSSPTNSATDSHSPPPQPPMTLSVSKSLSSSMPRTEQATRWDVKASQKFPNQPPGLDAFIY